MARVVNALGRTAVRRLPAPFRMPIRRLHGLASKYLQVMSMQWVFIKHHRSVKLEVIPRGAELSLRNYCTVNDPALLSVLKKSCYTTQDLRAGWFGPGLARTDKAEFKPLANWAIEHWAMYTGFLPEIRDKAQQGRILDVGCGLGYATVCLATLFDNFEITGIDMDNIAISFANRFCRRNNVDYISGDFLALRTGQQYNYIFALEILEHLPATIHYEFIDKCLSFLSKDGLLFITTPNALDEQNATHAHVGLLNRARTQAFLEKYKDCIVDASFYDNRELLSRDPNRFIIHDSVDKFEELGRNRSHFRFVMRRGTEMVHDSKP